MSTYTKNVFCTRNTSVTITYTKVASVWDTYNKDTNIVKNVCIKDINVVNCIEIYSQST